MNDDDIREQRSTLLSFLLAGLVCGSIAIAFFALCGGAALYVLAVIAGLAVFGYFHYLLWGGSMSKQADREREEEEEQAKRFEKNGQSEGRPRNRLF